MANVRERPSHTRAGDRARLLTQQVVGRDNSGQNAVFARESRFKLSPAFHSAMFSTPELRVTFWRAWVSRSSRHTNLVAAAPLGRTAGVAGGRYRTTVMAYPSEDC